MRSEPSRSDEIEPAQQQTEVYAKRWEPQEDFRDIPQTIHIIDALCKAFESEEERKAYEPGWLPCICRIQLGGQ